MHRTIMLPMLHRARILQRRARRPTDVVVRALLPVCVPVVAASSAEGEVRISSRDPASRKRTDCLLFDGRIHVAVPGSSWERLDLLAWNWAGADGPGHHEGFGFVLDPLLAGAVSMSGETYDGLDPCCVSWSDRDEAAARLVRIAQEIIMVDGVMWASVEEPVCLTGPRSTVLRASVPEWWKIPGEPVVRMDRIVSVPDLARVMPTVRGDVGKVRWRFPDWRRNAHASVVSIACSPSGWSALSAVGLGVQARNAASMMRRGSDAEAAEAVVSWTAALRESVDREILDPWPDPGRVDPSKTGDEVGEGLANSLRFLSSARDQMLLDGLADPWEPSCGLSDEIACS